VAALLVVAATFTIVDTIKHVIEGAHSRQISDSGAFILDRVLLMFIIAELLYTLRLVNRGGRTGRTLPVHRTHCGCTPRPGHHRRVRGGPRTL